MVAVGVARVALPLSWPRRVLCMARRCVVPVSHTQVVHRDLVPPVAVSGMRGSVGDGVRAYARAPHIV